jgi:membrane-bound lytic murein transglycosylase D
MLLLLLLVAGCAHQPVLTPESVASQISPLPTPGPALASDGSASQPATPAPSPIESDVAEAESAMANRGPDGAGASADATSGPPADSLATAKPADLLERLRSGFKFEEVDEPAVDAQLNWFANHPDFLERTFGRAALWLYYIVGQLEARHMPSELALLPVIESAFEPYAYSRASASGLWQFVSDTGRRFGLKQDWWYDGRRDPIEATRAALDYLQALHDEFNGDWLLAVAAYNCGELMVERAVERNQRLGLPTDFWHLRLPSETRGYVPELLAMRRLVGDPGRYGLEFSHIPDQPYFVPIATGGQIDLKVVADLAGISVDDLYELNPAFHRWATDPTGPDRLLVPTYAAPGLQAIISLLTPEQRMRVAYYSVHHGDTVARIAKRFDTKPEVIRELNSLGPNDPLVVDASLRVPSRDIQLPEKAMHAALLADGRGVRRLRHGLRPGIHIVRRGDTLYAIAQRLGTDVRTLAQLNGMSPGAPLRAGQRLRVGAARSTLVADNGASRGTRVAVVENLGVADTAVTERTATGDGARRMTYVVRRGDTLYGIARLLQVTVADLMGWNGISHHRDLRPGQTLVAFVKART